MTSGGGDRPRLSPAGAARLRSRAVAGSDVVVVSCMRDEIGRLPAFLDHYRRLGVVRFLVVDNASADGTAECLDAAPDVVRFETAGSYAASGCGIEWTNAVASGFAWNRWVLTVDADELFVYPRMDEVPVGRLVAYLDRAGSQAMAAPLLDMYAAEPSERRDFATREDILCAFPLFDGSGYERETHGGLPLIARGGPRRRVFWRGLGLDEGTAPFLVKFPLAKWTEGFSYRHSTHILHEASLADVSGLLLHFKFMPDFAERTALEVGRGEHWNDAHEYRVYAAALDGNIAPGLAFEGSMLFAGSDALVAAGLMHDSERYAAFTRRTGAP